MASSLLFFLAQLRPRLFQEALPAHPSPCSVLSAFHLAVSLSASVISRELLADAEHSIIARL